MVAIPRKAATVILLRETVPEGFEAFLLKRHERSSFMAGNFVYPEEELIQMTIGQKSIPIAEASHPKRPIRFWEEHFLRKKVWPTGLQESVSSLKKQAFFLLMNKLENISI